jgi:hypothetical protein
LNINPINENIINNEEALNIILDKINANGLDQLTDIQKAFLASL